MAIKLQHGSSSAKVSSSWRLDHELQQLALLLSQPTAINFQHVQRESNSLADKIAKWGVFSTSFLQQSTLAEIPNAHFKQECVLIVAKDITSNAGVHLKTNAKGQGDEAYNCASLSPA